MITVQLRVIGVLENVVIESENDITNGDELAERAEWLFTDTEVVELVAKGGKIQVIVTFDNEVRIIADLNQCIQHAYEIENPTDGLRDTLLEGPTLTIWS